MSLLIPRPDLTTVPEPENLLAVMCIARKWTRAAVVWAYVGEDHPFDFYTFAELGIISMSSPQFVKKYWSSWELAISRGFAHPVAIGDRIVVPEFPWTETGNRHMLGCSCGCSHRDQWAGR